MADHPSTEGVTKAAGRPDDDTRSDKRSSSKSDTRNSTVNSRNYFPPDSPFSNVPLDTEEPPVHHNLKSQTLTQDDLRNRPPMGFMSAYSEPKPASSCVPSCTSSKWIVLLLFIIPLVVVTTAALVVFGIMPLLTRSSGASKPPTDPKADTHSPRSLEFDPSEDAYIRLLSGVIVGCIIVILLLVGAFLACYCHRKVTRGGVDDGLLDGIPVRDGVVTLTKLHDERGEYRIDLSSGELNTTLDVDERDYIASVKENARKAQENHHSPDHHLDPVTIRRVADDDGLDDRTAEDNRRSSVRNSSYKRAIEGRSFYEFKNRPQSVLFDVNKFIIEKGANRNTLVKNDASNKRVSSNVVKSSSNASSSYSPPHSGSLSSTPSGSHSPTHSPKSLEGGRESLRHSSSGNDSCRGEVSPPDGEASPSSNLVNAKAPTSYGTLGRSRLLSSVDDDGYHFDNFGYSVDQAERRAGSPPIDPDSPFESFPGDQEQLYEDSGVDESTEEALDHSILDAMDRLEKDLQKSPKFGGCPDLDGSTSSPNTPSSEGSKDGHVLLRTKSSSSAKTLSKQDSFQGLPHQSSFDKFLSLVRLDSTTSLLSPVEEEPPERVPSLPKLDELAEIPVGQEAKQAVSAGQQEETPESKRKGMVFEDTNR